MECDKRCWPGVAGECGGICGCYWYVTSLESTEDKVKVISWRFKGMFPLQKHEGVGVNFGCLHPQ